MRPSRASRKSAYIVSRSEYFVSSAIESRRLFHSFFSPALTTAILLPSSIEAASEAAFAAFSPFSCMSSATDARASPSTPPIRESSPCESAITSSPCLPVRRITASSSAVDRLSGPRRSSFSRGRSSSCRLAKSIAKLSAYLGQNGL